MDQDRKCAGDCIAEVSKSNRHEVAVDPKRLLKLQQHLGCSLMEQKKMHVRHLLGDLPQNLIDQLRTASTVKLIKAGHP